MMTLTITLYQDEDEVWIAECPAIPGCISQGETISKAVANIGEAMSLCLEVRAAMGLPLPAAEWN